MCGSFHNFVTLPPKTRQSATLRPKASAAAPRTDCATAEDCRSRRSCWPDWEPHCCGPGEGGVLWDRLAGFDDDAVAAAAQGMMTAPDRAWVPRGVNCRVRCWCVRRPAATTGELRYATESAVHPYSSWQRPSRRCASSRGRAELGQEPTRKLRMLIEPANCAAPEGGIAELSTAGRQQGRMAEGDQDQCWVLSLLCAEGRVQW
jgi:hypothetical protein